LRQVVVVPVNFLNLAGLNVTDFKESETEYHVKATPVAVSRLCPHCGRSNETVSHARRKLVIRDIPAHGKIGVNEKTVRNIFDEYVASLEMQFKRETPVWLGIDEIKLKRFRAIFTNLQPRLSISHFERTRE